jgi:hypothetical protein
LLQSGEHVLHTASLVGVHAVEANSSLPQTVQAAHV